MLQYKIHADAQSLYNTPPAYGIYICGKVFKWLKKMGGLKEMKKRNEEKAKILYDFLDSSKLFKGTVRTLEYASMYYVDSNFKNLKKGSDEYWDKVSETFTKVVAETQPNYTTLQQAAVTREQSITPRGNRKNINEAIL